MTNLIMHPGSLLKKELDDRGLKQKDFADELQIAYSQFNEIIKGKRNISADLAILLEAALGIKALFWLNYQSQYDLEKSRIKVHKPITSNLEKWGKIRDLIPYSFFKKLNVITGDIAKDEATIKNIYNINALDKLGQKLISVGVNEKFKKTETRAFNPVNVVGWLSLVDYKAKEQEVGQFSIRKKDAIVSELRKVFFETDVVEKARKILGEAGIKLVVHPKPEQAPIDGVAFWSNKNPVIGLTKRYDRLDNFAFTLFHELGHIFLHGNLIKNNDLDLSRVDNLDDYAHNSKSNEEVEANEFASNNLIPSDAWKKFNEEHYDFPDNSIINFAEEIGIHPAIVVGRLRFENPILYRRRFRISNEIN